MEPAVFLIGLAAVIAAALIAIALVASAACSSHRDIVGCDVVAGNSGDRGRGAPSGLAVTPPADGCADEAERQSGDA